MKDAEAVGRTKLILAIVGFFFMMFMVFSFRDRIKSKMDHEELKPSNAKLRERNQRNR